MKTFRKLILIITLIAYCAGPLLALNISGRWSRGSIILDIDGDSIVVKQDGDTISKYRYTEKNGRLTIKQTSGKRDYLGEGTCYVDRDDDELNIDGCTYYREGMSTTAKVEAGAALGAAALGGALYLLDRHNKKKAAAQQAEGNTEE